MGSNDLDITMRDVALRSVAWNLLGRDVDAMELNTPVQGVHCSIIDIPHAFESLYRQLPRTGALLMAA